MKPASQRSYFDLQLQAELLQYHGGQADDIAHMAAAQGESVIRIARLLIELYDLPASEALSLANKAVYGQKYDLPEHRLS